MQTIIGLGNPGKNYDQTRHNVGFMFLDFLQNELQMPGFKLQGKQNAEVSSSKALNLIKPQTFMNNSGEPVRKYLEFYDKGWAKSLHSIYVAHDDLDLAFGTYKLQLGKGPKVHNGLTSIYQHLKSKDIWHIRIGIDNREGDRTIPGGDYVLSQFTREETEMLQSIFETIKNDLNSITVK